MKGSKVVGLSAVGCLSLFVVLTLACPALFSANYEYLITVSDKVTGFKQDGVQVRLDKNRQYSLMPEGREYTFTYAFKGKRYILKAMLRVEDGDSKALNIDGDRVQGISPSQYRLQRIGG